MARKSILTEADETVVEAAKAGAAVAKLAATAGLAAAGPAAAGVVLESVSKGLKSAEETAENVTPRDASEALGIMPSSGRKKTKKRKSAAKKRSAPKKAKGSKKTAVTKAAKKKRGTRQRKR